MTADRTCEQCGAEVFGALEQCPFCGGAPSAEAPEGTRLVSGSLLETLALGVSTARALECIPAAEAVSLEQGLGGLDGEGSWCTYSADSRKWYRRSENSWAACREPQAVAVDRSLLDRLQAAAITVLEQTAALPELEIEPKPNESTGDATCSACAAPLRPGVRFCPGCGADVTARG